MQWWECYDTWVATQDKIELRTKDFEGIGVAPSMKNMIIYLTPPLVVWATMENNCISTSKMRVDDMENSPITQGGETEP